MSRLVVVSNRVSLPDEHGSPPPGGMAIALSAALRRRHGLWMGWSGKVKAGEDPSGPISRREAGGINYALTDLSQTDLDDYYYGFANRVLWPVFHCRVDLAEYSEARMSGYQRVNRLFAKLLQPLISDDDVIWVHDYHLIPLAKELRNLGCGNKIGFFLHIPWPAADILFTVPHYDDLLRGLSCYDLVGFPLLSGAMRRLELGEIDLAIGQISASPPGYLRRSLYSDRFACLLRHDHPALAREWTIESFAALRHAAIALDSKDGFGRVHDELVKLDLQGRDPVLVSNILTAALAIAATDLLLIVPRRVATRIAALLPLAIMDPPVQLTPYEVALIWHERSHRDPEHRWLRHEIAVAAAAGTEQNIPTGKASD
ncbi:trehalose-6-phosphate synthase [Mesorhizobium sp. M0142]|uniref:trehalose-6-phosphate synthase n=1 Tax=unclassified Mesorhizobium TaxID=325217 RepID=UPI00333D0412